MKIIFDLLYIKSHDIAGVRIHGYNLVSDFLRYSPNSAYAILCWDFMKEFIQLKTGFTGEFILIPYKDIEYIHKGCKSIFMKYPSIKERMKTYDLCFTVYANDVECIFTPFIKQVGVVFDLQSIKLQLTERKNKIAALLYTIKCWRLYRKLDGIIAISNTAAKEIERFCGIRPKTIYFAVDTCTKNLIKPTHFPSNFKRYILDINSFLKYKNAETLLKAFKIIEKDDPTLCLYFKGYSNGGVPDYLSCMVRDLGLEENRVFFDNNNLSNEEIGWLHEHATIFVSPSLMEGFGSTPIEAIIHKVPTIISNIKTLIEVTQNKALPFKAKSAEDLADKIRYLLKNPISKDELYERSQFMAKRYSRESQMREYENYFRTIIG